MTRGRRKETRGTEEGTRRAFTAKICALSVSRKCRTLSLWMILFSLKQGDARIREREAQRAAEAAEKASQEEEDLDFEDRVP